MKSKLILLLAILPIIAADHSGYDYWSPSELKGLAKTLAPKINEHKIASQRLTDYGSHYTMFAHREGSGEAELHETESDVLVVESGNATITIGGEMVSPHTTAPGEQRADSIKGGTKQKLSAGDILHISPKVPHQMLLVPGARIDYFIIKVKQ